MYVIEFSFNKIVRLHSAAYYQIKNSTTRTFSEVLRKEKMYQSFNIFKKKNFCKAVHFLWLYGSTVQIFRLNKKPQKTKKQKQKQKKQKKILQKKVF